jgi:hypothetical protein
MRPPTREVLPPRRRWYFQLVPREYKTNVPTDHPEFVHPSAPEAAERLLEEARESVAAADRVVVGPWLGEVGFEVLYWIPFLHWLYGRLELDAERSTVVSRGGAEPWYAGLCGRYVDVFDALTPDEFRRTTLELWASTGGLQKQVHFRPWDERVLEATVGPAWREAALLHPSLLYRLFRNVWQGALPLREFLGRAEWAPWPTPTLGDGLADALPAEFTAVRFYFRESFPDTPANRALVDGVIERLAERRPVVLLNPGLVVDEHLDAEPAGSARVLRPLAHVPPARNLGAQTAVIARSALFVGTYGGLVHLAPFYGVPTVGFASDPTGINPVHLALARRTAAAYSAPLAVVDRRAFELLDAIAGHAATETVP